MMGFGKGWFLLNMAIFGIYAKFLGSTDWKINMLNPTSWRFDSDDFPFEKRVIFRFHVDFQGRTGSSS